MAPPPAPTVSRPPRPRCCSATSWSAPSVAARNAPEHAGTYDDEIALLLVHGTLHVLGRDHATDAETEAMQARERDLLTRFHRADP